MLQNSARVLYWIDNVACDTKIVRRLSNPQVPVIRKSIACHVYFVFYLKCEVNDTNEIINNKSKIRLKI